MKYNPWHQYPVISAFVLAAAAVLLLFSGFYLLDGIPDRPVALYKLKRKAVMGIIMWIVGCGIASRTRNDTWKRGFLCSLLFVPGLILLVLTTGKKNRHEIWEEANPKLAGKRDRRQYRDIKPLY